MPFDFKAYDQKCQGLTLEELQREWEHYTRLISGAATSTAVSGVAIPLTLGVSTIGVAMAAPAIHNARKKREIIERHLNRLNATHHTRKRDVLGSMAVSGTIGVVTLGVGSMGTEAIATAGAEHGIQAVVANETAIKIVSHAALDGAGMAVEHAHTSHLKKKDAHKAFQKAGVFQAVQDAKAAEAGYAAQPYQNNNQAYPGYAGTSSSQALPRPPPPYSVAVGQAPGQPAYNTTPNGYPQDFKAPTAHTPISQQSQTHLMPTFTGQQPLPQSYNYPHQQQIPPSSAPSPMPPANTQMFSPPQTPAVGYPVHAVHPQADMQSPQQSIPLQQPSAITPCNPSASAQPFNMAAMHQALPASTPTVIGQYQRPQSQLYSDAALPTPPQDNNQAYMSHPVQPQVTNQTIQGTSTGYFPPGTATPTGYPPPVISAPLQPTPQPVPAAQVPPPPPPAVGSANVPQMPVQHVVQHQTGPQQPATPVMQPQYHQYPSYTTPQSTGPHPQTYVPPPPPPMDPNRRDSLMSMPQPSFTPHAPYNPQNYGPISKQDQVHNSPTYATNGIPQATQVTQPPMQYHMPPPSPLPTGSIVNQYQHNSNGSYFPPPADQPQKAHAPGQPWQATQPAHQPYSYPPANYPPTPMSMPSPMPMTH